MKLIHDVASESLRKGETGDWYTIEAESRKALDLPLEVEDNHAGG